MSTEDWFEGDDNLDRSAKDPGGAGPGPSVIPGLGVPPSLMSYSTGAGPGESVVPGRGVPHSLVGGDTYPTTGDPATDEAIRQAFTNLRDIRDAHGTGQTPADGTFYTDAADRARGIQSDLKGVGRAAGTHWTGDAADQYQTINNRLAT